MAKFYEGMEILLQLENKYGFLRLGYYVVDDTDTFEVYFKAKTKNRAVTKYARTNSLRDAVLMFANRGKGVDAKIQLILAQPNQEKMLHVLRLRAGYITIEPVKKAKTSTSSKGSSVSASTKKKEKGSIPNTQIHPRYDEFVNIAIQCHENDYTKDECVEYLQDEGCPVDLSQKLVHDVYQNTTSKVLLSTVPDGYVEIRHKRGKFVVQQVQIPINYSSVPNRSRYNDDGQKRYFFQSGRFKSKAYNYQAIA